MKDRNDVSVIENEKIDFICNTSYCRPTANISWYICPQQCQENERKEIYVRTDDTSITNNVGFTSTQSSLELIPDRSKHGWNVFCFARNLDSYLSSNRLTLNITCTYNYDLIGKE